MHISSACQPASTAGGASAASRLRVRSTEDGFADETGAPNPDLPTTLAQVALDLNAEGRTVMVITTTFPSLDAMQELVKMGMEEGITLAIGQADALLVPVS